MHARAPITASPKLVASEAWQELLHDGQTKHRRFIWATQFGVGSTSAGPQGRRASKRALLQRALSERPNVNFAEKARHEANRARKLAPIRLIGWTNVAAS